MARRVDMTREDALKGLGVVLAAMRKQFAGQPDRLHAFENHLATCIMHADHMYDHAENASAEGQG